MTAPRALFVKLSSLGDVIHNLPAVTDVRRHRPEVRIDWAVEESYAPLVALHPGVERAIAVGLRRLRSRPHSAPAWGALLAARGSLRREAYDFIVDTQGLAKSAFVARLSRGPVFGFDSRSAREPFAARFYDQALRVDRRLHAVERNRRLAAQVFGYSPAGSADYGIAAPGPAPDCAPQGRYYVALHASSRDDKLWAARNWVELAERMAGRGLTAVYPGGSDAEREAASRLASFTPGAVAAPALSLLEAACLIAGAQAVAGVDTGLTHLAVALGKPTAGIYCATDPALTGLHGGAHAVNLGGVGAPPSVDAVLEALGYGDRAP